ncbi:hypothetical protein [Shewanella surugensis]|uniref:ATP-grasp domain-containing protein n=1 Tax=Shewanella surugensis TaxID=212020 RepID=A0ABT0LJD0_9GAMM|nr:hypothetical protein [Shewanella surugensis]MCL1127407.1 hypothetical protein [Shewanella surugensis]
MALLWIRTEKKANEQRVPIIPEHTEFLITQGHEVVVESSSNRAIDDEAYLRSGCRIVAADSWHTAPDNAFILGLKHIEDEPGLGHKHIYFAHAYNNERNFYEKKTVRKLLDRFVSDKGTHFDLEFLTDAQGERIAAFGKHAGIAGALVGILVYQDIQLGKIAKLPLCLDNFLDDSRLVKDVIHQSAFDQKNILLIGNGRCGEGVRQYLDAFAIDYEVWGRHETGCAQTLATMVDYDIVFNCVSASNTTGTFIDKTSLNPDQKLRLIVDIGCETNNNNPIKLYDTTSTFEKPAHVVKTGDAVLHIVAIDNLPSLIPKASSSAFSKSFLPHLNRLLQGQCDTPWLNARAYFSAAIERHKMQTQNTIFMVQDARFNKKIDYSQLNICGNDVVLVLYHNSSDTSSEDYRQYHFNAVFSMADEEPDFNEIIKVVDEYIHEFNISEFDFVTSAEAAVTTCGRLGVHYHLTTDDMMRYNNKLIMKDLVKHEFVVPNYISAPKSDHLTVDFKQLYQDTVAELGLGFFAKPIDKYSSIGTKRVKTFADFISVKHYISDMDFEFDEFVSGKLYHIDSFVQNETLIFVQVFEYMYPCYEFIEGKPLGSCMLAPDSDMSKKLREYNQHVLDVIKPPKNGMTHLEVFERKNGELVFLEIAARPSGALVPELHEKCFGIKIREEHLKLSMYPAYEFAANLKKFACFASYPLKNGVVTQIVEPHVESEYSIISKIEVGQFIDTQVNKISDIAISIVMWNEDQAQLYRDFLILKNTQLYTTQEESVRHED